MAFVAPSVKFKNRDSVHIGPFAVLEDGVEIGENCYIGSGAKIKTGVILGDNCTIKENAVVSHAILGNNVNIGEPVLYFNSLDCLSIALNQGNFAKKYNIKQGDITIYKIQ